MDVCTTGGDGDEFATSSYADFLDLKADNTVFTEMRGYSPMMAPLSLGGRSRIALGQVVTSNHFTMLGVPPFLGRLLVPADDEPSAARVVVISHRMWQREFGADPAIAASRLVVGAVPAAVVAFALQGVLYGVQPLDPLAWGLAFTAMAMAAGPANFVPARRAMRIDPMTALRTD